MHRGRNCIACVRAVECDGCHPLSDLHLQEFVRTIIHGHLRTPPLAGNPVSLATTGAIKVPTCAAGNQKSAAAALKPKYYFARASLIQSSGGSRIASLLSTLA